MDSKMKCPKCERDEIFKHDVNESDSIFYCQYQKCKYIWKNFKSTLQQGEYRVNSSL
ncbi:MAG: hypothetical protein JST55_04720 [Bacteroidetes bacterium]|nr:hypothetical protein [Bacteroidota bacterium]